MSSAQPVAQAAALGDVRSTSLSTDCLKPLEVKRWLFTCFRSSSVSGG